METKTINILFSRYKDFNSKIIYLIGGRSYTHVSIALDEDNEYFYSFNKKGFRKEYPKKHKKLISNTLYKIEVTQEEFDKIKSKIEEFEIKKDVLKYSLLGVLFCFLRIKRKSKNKYFCSQFVAETLTNIKEFKLEKDASLYFPHKLAKTIKEKLSIVEIKNGLFLKKSY